ncbi:MAG TPA: hypothetical protein DEF00_04320 [Candidatus Taylorbacteria bacterium]|nr:MAG: hypothetical protein UY03_C0008G0026 [Parcubacteria group bacterium GW2011_GWA2_47_64]KKU97127.1 MAG: hypothetical protein UY29_C0002G0024 [Parcubacteria group bacterium GW2011_GWC2_48_17]HBV01578.1 hypothetical protein [Candidatus Taylorbacteria bacterium]
MQEFIKADIFFFITTVAVLLVTGGIIIALYYVIKILRNVHDVTDRVEEGTKALSEDISLLRSNLKSNGFAWRSLFMFLRKYARWFTHKKGRAKTDG